MNEFENDKNINDNAPDGEFNIKSSNDYFNKINETDSQSSGYNFYSSSDITQEDKEPSTVIESAENAENINADGKPSVYSNISGNTSYSNTLFGNGEAPSYEQNKTADFYTTTTKPYKKKRYMSVKAATFALVFTAVLSIVGGAVLSGLMLKDKYPGGSGNKNIVSVQDNIDSSKNYVGDTKQATNNALNGEALTTPEIVDKVGPAVVGIINKTTYGDAYGYYGSLYGNLEDEIEQSSGSGVIISSDGYIVTNNHVVENATALTVILNTGKEYSAKMVGRDSSTDLAVIKIDGADLAFAQMGSSSDLRVGETAVAIGNPLGQEFAGTTTQGIISGLNRSVTVEDKTMNLIQTDAAINPGNSGGALVNQYGHLIGINTVKISSSTLEGLGFAIPIDEAKPIIEELMVNGYVTGRPIIGIGGRAVTEEDAKAYNLKVGVYVSSMTPSGPAYMAGIKIGDIIVECDGEPIETVDDINEVKNKKKPGEEMSVKVYRKGDYVDLKIILGEESPSE